MKLSISISCVDGADEVIQTVEPRRAQFFLNDRDHEGSNVGGIVALEGGEEVYAVLTALQELVERRKRNS